MLKQFWELKRGLEDAWAQLDKAKAELDQASSAKQEARERYERLRPIRNLIAHGRLKQPPHTLANVLTEFASCEKQFEDLNAMHLSARQAIQTCQTELGRIQATYDQINLFVFWELFSFILPGKTRRECFDPAYGDLLEDYVRARKFVGKWARRWIAFAFTIRTLFMVADCFRVLLQSGTGRIVLGLLPESFRNWWRRQ